MADFAGTVIGGTLVANQALPGTPKAEYSATASTLQLRFGGSAAVSTSNVLYRGRSGGNYVYQVGSPPGGATDVVIIAIY